MSDKKFDRILQDKLKGYQITFDNSKWEDMEKVLNQNEQTTRIDQEVRHRLKEHTYPYQESHWQILKRKLELEKELKEKIYISKIAEVSILLLLLLSALNLKENYAPKGNYEKHVTAYNADNYDRAKDHIQAVPIQSTGSQSVPLTTQTDLEPLVLNQPDDQTVDVDQASIIPNTFTKIQNQNPSITTTISQNDNSANTESTVDELRSIPENTTHSTFGLIPSEESKPSFQTTKPSPIEIESSSTKKEIHNDQPSLEPQETNETIAEKQLTPNSNRPSIQTSPLFAIDKTSQLANKDNAKLSLTNQMINSLLDRQIDIATLQAEGSDLVTAMTVAQPLRKKERWIGAMTGVDMNYVRSRVNINNVSGPRNFLVLSLTTGVNYSVKKGRNEFFTGLGYSEKFYDPNIVETVKLTSTFNSVESSSYYSRDYTLEQYNIVHLPAQYRRHLGDSQKLHAYAFVGASVNFVIYTDYEQHDNLNRGQPRPKRLVDQLASYKSTDFSSGLLEGGFYKDNIYFTADIGAGLEKQLRRTKFFVESQYKRNLFASQLGPRKVKLNSLSFNLGAKYKI